MLVNAFHATVIELYEFFAAFRKFSMQFFQFLSFTLHLTSGNEDALANAAANAANAAPIKEEPIDPIEIRRLQQLTANSQFVNGNYQFNNNTNGTTFTPLTPATVLHHQPHVPGEYEETKIEKIWIEKIWNEKFLEFYWRKLFLAFCRKISTAHIPSLDVPEAQ